MRFGGEGLLTASAPSSQPGAVSPEDLSAKDAKTAPLAPAADASRDAVANINDKLSPLRRESRASKPAPRAVPPRVVPTAADPIPVQAETNRLDPARPKALEVANFGPVPKYTGRKGETGVSRTPSLPAARQAPFYRVQGVELHDVLNVRRGPSGTYDTIASIPPTGKRVEITGRCQDDGWCPIRYGRVRGWVNSYYLAAEGVPGSSSQSQVYLARP
jgi:hypothetical protein